MTFTQDDCWVLTTGEAGMRSQVIGLAEATKLAFKEKQIRLRAPWSWLPGHRCPWTLSGLSAEHDRLEPPWPRLLISCGRRSTAASIAIRRRSAGSTRTVHIQDPQAPPGAFDLIIPMRHDGLAGENVFTVETALHRVSSAQMLRSKEQWQPILKPDDRPMLGVILGGANRYYRFTAGAVDNLVQLTNQAFKRNYRVAVTPSRRTEPHVTEELSRRFSGDSGFFLWNGTGSNPYLGLMALSDRLIVTCESVSMVSEALATGHPVHVLRLSGKGRRHELFLDNLVQRDLISLADGDMIDWNRKGALPVDETPKAAAAVLRLISKENQDR